VLVWRRGSAPSRAIRELSSSTSGCGAVFKPGHHTSKMPPLTPYGCALQPERRLTKHTPAQAIPTLAPSVVIPAGPDLQAYGDVVPIAQIKMASAATVAPGVERSLPADREDKLNEQT
jgi:hypothetical protein